MHSYRFQNVKQPLDVLGTPRLNNEVLGSDVKQQVLCGGGRGNFGMESCASLQLLWAEHGDPRGPRSACASGALGHGTAAASSKSWGHAVNGALCLCRDGNNLPFQCCPTSGFPATRSCAAEYFAAFLIYTYQILAGIEAWLISHYNFPTKGLIHEEEERGLLRR